VKRLYALAIPCLVFVAAFPACRKFLPENQYLTRQDTARRDRASTADALAKFDHRAHATIFAEQSVACVDCHAFDLKLSVGDGDLAEALSAHGLHRGSEACHTCHGPPQRTVASAPDRCTTCHDNLNPIMPDNHNGAWQRVHGSIARGEGQSCASCHDQTFCVDCHQRRDEIQTRVHERNFRFFHSVEARANPRKCGVCHRVDFCSNCHERSRANGG